MALYLNGKEVLNDKVVGGTWTAQGIWTLPAVTLGGIITMPSGGQILGAGTEANCFVLKNPKNSTNAGVSGTAKTVEIDIAGVPYYFLVSPTSTA